MDSSSGRAEIGLSSLWMAFQPLWFWTLLEMRVWILALQMEDKLALPETSCTSLTINLWTFSGHRHDSSAAMVLSPMRVRRQAEVSLCQYPSYFSTPSATGYP